jgi:DNA-binding response OmpR family regulator
MEKFRVLIASPFPHFLADMALGQQSEYDVQRANSEDVVNFLTKEWNPQLILIDGDSVLFNACDRIRQRFPFEQMGMILVTREFTSAREERGLRAGCDQVISYPTGIESLMLRMRTLTRRIHGVHPYLVNGKLAPAKPEPIVFGDIKVFPQDNLIRRGETIVPMTPIQFRLLMMFLQNKEQLLSRQWIKEKIWDTAEISLRSIDAQISKLRKIVPELDPHLVNIYGKGYVFTEARREAA